MEMYIGLKTVGLVPMNRKDYNDYRGWNLPADEDGTDEGYLVEYMDGGKPNHPDHKGYISWSPKEQADNAYRPVEGMPFGTALELLNRGGKVARKGWNMFLIRDPYIRVVTVDGIVNEPWIPSKSDVISEDWTEIA